MTISTAKSKSKAGAVVPAIKQQFDLSTILAKAGLSVSENTRLSVQYFHPLLVIKAVTVPLNMEVFLRLRITKEGVKSFEVDREERNDLIYRMLDENVPRRQIQDMLGIKNTIIDSALATLQK